ncbi:MAG: divergent polysaccharide deacetylase family protein [Candidatus Ratteibacteria bacterium]|nr:divergent polysaccharide deacetylase family protein [Candidatus Ratteibacteria bacterium]
MNNKKVLIFGLLALLIVEMFIWGTLHQKKMYPTRGETLSSLVEKSLNKALVNFGITEENIVKKYWEEKTSQGKEKWIQIHEEFVIPQSISLNEILKDIDKKTRQTGGKILSYNFLEGGRKLQITLGKENIATHSLVISKDLLPKIAIIIDDMGYGREIEKEILKLSYPLTISILPRQKDSLKTAETAHNSGFEVLMHQPLESKNADYNTIQGLITEEMSKEEIKSILKQNLKTIPYAKGINNHEGSKGMENEETVSELLDILKKENMFFINSLTTPDSTAKKIAIAKGLEYLERDIFLDNKKDEKYISEQIDELISQALSNGQAIGIAHPSQATLNALKKALPEIETEGIKIVPVSQLLEK